MAIAYYIPDQRKLLGRGGGGHTNNNSNNNTSDHNNNNNTNTTTSNNSPPQPSAGAGGGATATTTRAMHENNFRANITIPLRPFAPTPPSHAHRRQQGRQQPSVGCWDLIAQVFCYALRFYHEGGASPSSPSSSAVIQITVEITGNGSHAAAAMQQQPTGSSTPSSPSSSSVAGSPPSARNKN